MSCIICNGVKSEVLCRFTDKTWSSCLSAASKWINIGGNESEVAGNIIDVKKAEDLPPDSGFHRSCYCKFTNKIVITRRMKLSQSTSRITSKDKKTTVLGKRTRKQTSSSISSSSRSTNVLPPECVICHKVKRITDRKSGSRRKEHLSTCEYISGGLLREAAEGLNDESLLLLIRDKDMVAIEAKYHRSCYKKYTNKYIEKTDKSLSNETVYTQTFKKFCSEVVEKQIIEEGKIFPFTKLLSTFKSMFSTGPDAYTCGRNGFYVKHKLKTIYPQLRFVKRSKRNQSELVLLENNQSTLADMMSSDSLQSSEDSAPEQHDIDKQPRPSTACTYGTDIIQRIYLSASYIRSQIATLKGLKNVWPVTTADIENYSYDKIVPAELYNMLAWITGVTEEVCHEGYVATPPDCHWKIMSIAQDIVYLSSGGRTTTPKHVTLGMTLRHWTGSSRLIDLLHGFGHCASHSYVLEHDTALAELQLRSNRIIPDGFQKATATTLVWDNNDFSEETVSGEGTTHNTNGIIIQRLPNTSTNTNQVKEKMPKSRKRSVACSSIPLVYYSQNSSRTGPATVEQVRSMNHDLCKSFINIDSMYYILKCPDVITNHKILPGWTGFNTLLNEGNVPVMSKVGYLPVIDSSPTDMSTVNTILVRSLEIADELQLANIVVVCDQAIYCKAQQIRWQNDNFKKRIVIRLGDFHTSMCLLSAIGKRYKGSGIEDILIEAGVVAAGSMNGVMSGHHYNRSVRAHKLLAEALSRLRFQRFLESASEDETEDINTLVSHLRDVGPCQQLRDILTGDECQRLLTAYDTFIQKECESNPTFNYYSSYIDMVENLLLFIRATREGNWELHLASIHQMLPWMFAYDRLNYARYLPAYLIEMETLEKENPVVFQSFMKGEFAVQRQDKYSFSQIACDQVIEQTMNRDSKTKGGMIGITTSKHAVNRWILSHHERAGLATQCQLMAGLERSDSSPKDLAGARVKSDETAVSSLTLTISSMMNPFSYDGENLLNISSGVVASDLVTQDLLKAFTLGQQEVDKFFEKRLTSGATVDFYSSLSIMTLKTFNSNTQSKASTKNKSQGQSITLKTTNEMLSRLLIVAKQRHVDLKYLLSFSLCDIPPSLATVDGMNIKTDKSKLMHALCAADSTCIISDSDIPSNSALIIDGMALLQTMQCNRDTFSSLADKVLNRIVFMAQKHKCKRVDFVIDRYPSVSIKNCERGRRASTGVQKIHISKPEQPAPKQFRKFLLSGANKEMLCEFLFSQWQVCSGDNFKDLELYVCHGQQFHRICCEHASIVVSDVEELTSDHEEADTRIILHSKHASMSFRSVIIASPDTDVMVLLTSYAQDIECQIFFVTGTRHTRRVVNISKVAAHFGPTLCRALPGLHVFTGCDSVSAFKGKGKVKALELTKQSDKFTDMFIRLGTQWELDSDSCPDFEEFVCQLYGVKTDLLVNEARYTLYKTRYVTDDCLPPNDDCLRKHLMRATYQVAIYKRAMCQFISCPPPEGHGWKTVNDELVFDWMAKPLAPEGVLKHVQCKCKKTGCTKKTCSCLNSSLPCTDLCMCINCGNPTPVQKEIDHSDTSDTDDDEL